jgi:hypothetical protein
LRLEHLNGLNVNVAIGDQRMACCSFVISLHRLKGNGHGCMPMASYSAGQGSNDDQSMAC